MDNRRLTNQPYLLDPSVRGSEDGSQHGSDGSDDRGLDDSEQGLEPMAVASSSSARRPDRRVGLRALVVGVGLVLLAGAGTVAFLVGSTSVPPATRAKARAFVPFLDRQWRYINSCQGVVIVEDYGPAGGAPDKNRAEPIELVYDNRPHFTLFGDSITEMSYNPEQLGFSALLANAYVLPS